MVVGATLMGVWAPRAEARGALSLRLPLLLCRSDGLPAWSDGPRRGGTP